MVATPSPIASEDSPHSAMPPTARVDDRAVADDARDRAVAQPVAAVPAAAPEPQLEEMDMMDAEIVELGGEPAARREPREPRGGSRRDGRRARRARRAGAQVCAASRRSKLRGRSGSRTAREDPAARIGAANHGARAVARRHVPRRARGSGSRRLSDVDDLLQTDMSGGPISKDPPGMPTMEQLGETVELEGADAPAARLELVETAEDAEEAPLDDLELALPKQEFSGGYHAQLAPPQEAAADLERHKNEQASAVAAAPPSLSSPASIPVSAPTHAALRHSSSSDRRPRRSTLQKCWSVNL